MLCHQPCVQGETKQLGKVEEKSLCRETSGPPHYTLLLGTFTLFIFYLMNCLHFSAIQAPHKFVFVLVSLSAMGKNHGGVLEGIKMCIQTPVYLILIIVASLFFMTGNLYIKSRFVKIIVFKMFLKFTLPFQDEGKIDHINLENINTHACPNTRTGIWQIGENPYICYN